MTNTSKQIELYNLFTNCDEIKNSFNRFEHIVDYDTTDINEDIWIIVRDIDTQETHSAVYNEIYISKCKSLKEKFTLKLVKELANKFKLRTKNNDKGVFNI